MKSLTSRTGVLTALAVAGVLVAGTAAVAANIGILNSTNDSSIGSLSATDDLVESTSTTTATTVPASSTTTSLPGSEALGESYVVDDAGIVTLSSASGTLTLVSAVPEPGWTVIASQPDLTSLEVTFANGTRSLVFSAVLGPDGIVLADVVEPVDVMGTPAATPATGSPSATTPTTTIDDDHDDDHDDDDSDDDHDRDDDDHDDDHDEYEGADDDD
jgi:hypothetical protein